MLLLHKFEEGSHVRSTKVVYCLESCEHAPLAQPLEVVLTDVLEG